MSSGKRNVMESPVRRRIVRYLAENPESHRSKIATALGMNYKTIERNLRVLMKEIIVSRRTLGDEGGKAVYFVTGFWARRLGDLLDPWEKKQETHRGEAEPPFYLSVLLT